MDRSCRELKTEIEGLQGELSRSQAVLQKDFQAWHQVALAEARAAASTGGGGGVARASTSSTSSRPGVKQTAPLARTRAMAGSGTAALRDGTNVVDLS